MKYLKYALGGIALIAIALFIYVKVVLNEKRPQVIKGVQAEQMAEQMADKMLKAVDKEAWDTLPYISWTFRDSHHFVWDKKNNNALVKWEDYTVHLNPDQIDGKAYKGSNLLGGDESYKAVRDAWSFWCNDMFWLAAPYKIKDPGVTLNIAKDKDGKEGLLVSYSSGGVTPGDAYLWYLDKSGMPTGYKMWVDIIPVGGMYFSWQNWVDIAGGSKFASFHQANIKKLKIDVTNIKGGDSWEDVGYDKSPILL